ncbi:hypothetical protein D9758_001561 [Tetrapyrgos nigripes]|uniref:F-box domain-containing protein n=1 Tax=Tetrapyrgos nigripes TaxID=182062 RepID=A0A8H5GY04_9AGAR|nr:hypothetical protein D9758_001561 [Tetrapyrgos nigripes]
MYPFDSTLLDTNKVPEDQDRHAIQKICSEHSQDLERMNAQIQRLESMLCSITQKRDTLQSKVSSLKSIISPLRNLPAEILQHIFQDCLEPFPTISTQESPFLLTRICSRWRSVAVATPELWAAIHVFMPQAVHALEPHGAKCDAIREGVQYFLSRSGTLPLSISLYSDADGEHQDDLEEATRTLDMLIPFLHRSKYLNLNAPLVTMLPLQRLEREGLGSLETVILSRSRMLLHNEPDLSDALLPLLHAPHLRRLWIGIAFPILQCTDWSKLTHLSIYPYIQGVKLGDIMVILSMSPNLMECSIPLEGDFEGDTPLKPLSLTKLRRLTISSHGTGSATTNRFFDLLIVAVLQEFSIVEGRSWVHDSWPAVYPSIGGLFLRSSCPLLKFSIEASYSGSRLPEGHARSMLGLLRFMTDLGELALLNGDFINDDLLNALSVISPTSDVICPSLTRIRFRDAYAFSEKALMDFLSARCSPPLGPVTPLEVVLDDPRPHLPSRLAQFGQKIQFRPSYRISNSMQELQTRGRLELRGWEDMT